MQLSRTNLVVSIAVLYQSFGSSSATIHNLTADVTTPADFPTTAARSLQSENEQERCFEETGSCPVARCAAPPTGCTIGEGNLHVRSDGSCCHDMCAVTCSSDAPREPCSQEAASCPVARCAVPPEGCTIGSGDLVVLGTSGDGACCQELCRVTCSTDNNDVVSLAQESGDDEAERCFEESASCPIAKCDAPPTNCAIGDGDLVVNSDGACCHEMCQVSCPNDSNVQVAASRLGEPSDVTGTTSLTQNPLQATSVQEATTSWESASTSAPPGPLQAHTAIGAASFSSTCGRLATIVPLFGAVLC